MPAAIDLTGQTFARLTVIRRSTERAYRWECRCACGTTIHTRSDGLKRGDTKSCGCMRRESFVARNTKHGHAARESHGREYWTWASAKARCTCPTNPKYADYGGRGITMCERWLNDPNAFITDMGPKPTGYTLDRINNEGPYAPDNCRWATRRTQQNNRRMSKRLTHDGLSLTRAEWTRRLGLNKHTIEDRVTILGWSVERALTTPLGAARARAKYIEFGDERHNLSEWGAKLGYRGALIAKRLRHGWTVEKALTTPPH